MAVRGTRSLEITLWAVWLGALWFLAILVAPALFKWLPRADAGLVAGRLFYMMSWYSLVMAVLLQAVAYGAAGLCERASGKARFALWAVLLVCAVELLWLHPTMQSLRETMTSVTETELEAIRAQFGRLHGVSSALYGAKAVAALVWGLSRYQIKPL